VLPGKPVRLTATANEPLRWSVTVHGPGGAAVRHLVKAGRSKSLSLTWNGLDNRGVQVPPGKYLAVIGGTTSNGDEPRRAALQVDVPGPLAGPRPVPSGSVKVPNGFATFRDVTATGAADVWAVGVVAGNGAVKPLARHLGDRGWSSFAAPNPGVHGSGFQTVDATDPNDVWAGGFSCLSASCGPNGGFGSRTLVEHWTGKSWTAVATPSPGTALNEIRAVDALAPDDVWAAGLWSDRGRWLRHGLVLHWDGSAWRQVPIPFLGGEVHLDGVSAAGPDDLWVVGEACPGPCSGLAHSVALTLHWDGTRFTRIPPAGLSADRSGLDAVLAVSAGDAWAVGGRSANRVAPTHPLTERWDGHHWRLVDTPLAGKSSHWFGLTPVPGAGLWSVGGWLPDSAERPLVVRRNASGHWAKASVPSPNVHLAYLTGVAAISRTNVWAVGPATSGPLALHWTGGAGWSIASTG
jgi:hypothetical protein